jgi:hypothetical protein
MTGRMTGETSWRGMRGTCPFRHLIPCATIPGAVCPSPVMWSHSRSCEALCRRDVTTPAPVQPELSHQQDLEPAYGWRPDADASKTTLEIAPRSAQEPPRCLRELWFARTTVTPWALHASIKILCEISCNMSISGLPLAYKRRRQPPSCGHRIFTPTNTRPQPHFPSSRYWHFASITQQGLGGFSFSPTLFVAPLYLTPGAKQYITRNLLDIRPHGRNQDKLVSLCCIAPTIGRLITAHLTS